MQLACLPLLATLLAALLGAADASPLPQRHVAIPRINMYDSSIMIASVPDLLLRTPHKAHAVQLAVSPANNATVPAFVSGSFSQGAVSQATHAYISIHGQARNPNVAFKAIHDVVGERHVVVAPGFFVASDRECGASGMCWSPVGKSASYYDWQWGANAEGKEALSSFEVLDDIVKFFATSPLYPALQNLTVVGHSAGAGFVQRWSYLGGGEANKGHLSLRYVTANAPSHLWFTADRPVSIPDCRNQNEWRYGLEGPLPPYVKDRVEKASFAAWIKLPYVHLMGTNDVWKAGRKGDHEGDQSCASRAQGGRNRFDRNAAFWYYINALAGTKTPGLDMFIPARPAALLRSTLKPIPDIADTFAHRVGVVLGVGHSWPGMFGSMVGRSALLEPNFARIMPGVLPSTQPVHAFSLDNKEQKANLALKLNLAHMITGRAEDAFVFVDNGRRRRDAVVVVQEEDDY